ncbi:hypothetical protein [Streptomyces sp. NPDC055709]
MPTSKHARWLRQARKARRPHISEKTAWFGMDLPKPATLYEATPHPG